jgi:uncharacterized protein YegL
MTNEISTYRFPRPQSTLDTIDFNPRRPQQVTALLVDMSGSMQGDPTTATQQSLNVLVDECVKDPELAESLHIQLVTFGETIRAFPFTPVLQFRPPLLSAGGRTPLAEAVLGSIPALLDYVGYLRETMHTEVLPPNVLVLTDGWPTSPAETLEAAAAAIAGCERAGAISFYGFTTAECAISNLQPLFVRPVHLLPKSGFKQFFRVVSASVRRVSCTVVGQEIDLAPTIRAELRFLEDDSHA